VSGLLKKVILPLIKVRY